MSLPADPFDLTAAIPATLGPSEARRGRAVPPADRLAGVAVADATRRPPGVQAGLRPRPPAHPRLPRSLPADRADADPRVADLGPADLEPAALEPADLGPSGPDVARERSDVALRVAGDARPAAPLSRRPESGARPTAAAPTSPHEPGPGRAATDPAPRVTRPEPAHSEVAARPVWEELDQVAELPGLVVLPATGSPAPARPGTSAAAPLPRWTASRTGPASSSGSAGPEDPQLTPVPWSTPAPTASPAGRSDEPGPGRRAPSAGGETGTPAPLLAARPVPPVPPAGQAAEPSAPLRVGPRDLTPSAVDRVARDVARTLRRAEAAERERRGEAPWRP